MTTSRRDIVPTPRPTPQPTRFEHEALSTEQLQARVAQLEVELAHLQLALGNRPAIKHASGMIMLLMPCTAEAAFAALKYVSQHTNRPLRDVAAVITTAASEGQPVPGDIMSALDSVMPPRAARISRPRT